MHAAHAILPPTGYLLLAILHDERDGNFSADFKISLLSEFAIHRALKVVRLASRAGRRFRRYFRCWRRQAFL